MQKIRPFDGGHNYVLATLCPFEGAFLSRAAEIVNLDNIPAEEKVALICNLRDITRRAEDAWRAECQSWAAFVRREPEAEE